MNRPTSFVLNVGDCIIPCMRVYIYLHYILSMPLLHNVLGVVLNGGFPVKNRAFLE